MRGRTSFEADDIDFGLRLSPQAIVPRQTPLPSPQQRRRRNDNQRTRGPGREDQRGREGERTRDASRSFACALASSSTLSSENNWPFAELASEFTYFRRSVLTSFDLAQDALIGEGNKKAFLLAKRGCSSDVQICLPSPPSLLVGVDPDCLPMALRTLARWNPASDDPP